MENINPKTVIIAVYCLIQSGILAIGEFVNAGFLAIGKAVVTASVTLRKTAVTGFTAATIIFNIGGLAIASSSETYPDVAYCVELIDSQTRWMAKNNCDFDITFSWCAIDEQPLCNYPSDHVYYTASVTVRAHGATSIGSSGYELNIEWGACREEHLINDYPNGDYTCNPYS